MLMINWIIGLILVIWLIIKRFSKDGKIKGLPLGMPRGTVRAFITLLVITFPLTYLVNGEEIPRLIVNAIFVLTAFYFSSRKEKSEKLKHIIKQIKNPEKYQEEMRKEKKPLYLPKYTVRSFLLITLVVITFLNFLGPEVPFETTTNTLVDLLVIVFLYIIGSLLGRLMNFREKSRIEEQINKMGDSENLSIFDLLEGILEQTSSWLVQKSKNLISLITLIAVTTSLLCYTIGWDYILLSLPFYDVSLRETLLLLINVYFGFRE